MGMSAVTPTTSLLSKAAGNLSYLMSIMRTNEILEDDERIHAEAVIEQLREAARKEANGMSVLINDSVHCLIWKAVESELKRANTLHPNYNTDTVRRTAIIVEEALEAITMMSERAERLVKAALGATREEAGDTNKEATIADLEKELIQTAAMCFRMLESMAKEGKMLL